VYGGTARSLTASPYKRARTESISASSTITSLSAIDASLLPSDEEERDTTLTANMRQPEALSDSNPTSNGHVANGHSNGSSTTASSSTSRRSATIKPVALPGTTLYDDSEINREEFVRLVIQSLRDVGYM
jgi:hypothetical protein